MWCSSRGRGEHRGRVRCIFRVHGRGAAEVAELVDALDLGSSGETRPGSSPGFRILNFYRRAFTDPTNDFRMRVGLRAASQELVVAAHEGGPLRALVVSCR